MCLPSNVKAPCKAYRTQVCLELSGRLLPHCCFCLRKAAQLMRSVPGTPFSPHAAIWVCSGFELVSSHANKFVLDKFLPLPCIEYHQESGCILQQGCKWWTGSWENIHMKSYCVRHIYSVMQMHAHARQATRTHHATVCTVKTCVRSARFACSGFFVHAVVHSDAGLCVLQGSYGVPAAWRRSALRAVSSGAQLQARCEMPVGGGYLLLHAERFLISSLILVESHCCMKDPCPAIGCITRNCAAVMFAS